MGKNKERFTEERENFFTRLNEGEEYAILSCDMEALSHIQNTQTDGINYTLHQIKQKNSEHKENDLWCDLDKQKKKIKKEITKIEQYLNHNK